MEASKKPTEYHAWKTMLIVFGCVLINFLGKHFAATLELPLWLDCLGTVFAAYVFGPISGAVVGCTGNIIYSFWKAESLAYGLTSIFIGLSVGMAARKKYFESFFKTTSLAGGLTIGSVLISTALNLLICGGSTGNIWGDGVRDFLHERGVSAELASAAGELYLDFLDKLVTVLALYFLIIIVRKIRARGNASRQKRRGLVIGLLALALCAEALAVPTSAADGAGAVSDVSYIQKIYDADNGLPGGHANDIVQTNDGVLWVGTNSGLYRYTGSSFRYMDEFDSVKNVNCLYVDQEGRLWIGTNDNGLVLSINEQIVNTLDSVSGLPTDSVRSIVQSADGDYYIGTSGFMALVRIAIGITVTKTIQSVGGVQSISADADGHVAAVSADGRLYILQNQDVFCTLSAAAYGTVFSTCAFDESGTLYAGTANGSVRTYRIGDGGAEEIGSIACGGTARINQIFFHAGNAWILSETGVGVLNRASFQRIDTGSFNSSVGKMAVDYQGNLWFASARHGLLQLSETSFPNLNKKYGLAEDAVNTTCVRNDVLYIGTERGLDAVDLRSGDVIRNSLTEALSGTAVKCVVTDADGALWICSSGKGLLCAAADGAIRSYCDSEGIRKAAYVCTALSDGGVAVGGDGGLTLIRGNETVTIPNGDKLGSSQILSICELSDGRLLLGTNGNGLIVVKDGIVRGHMTKQDGLTSDVVRRIVPDETERILFLITGNSLCYMENNRIAQIPYFPYSDNFDIVLDNGAAFVLSSAGIYVVRKDALLSGGRYDCALLDYKVGLKGSLTENAWNALRGGKELFLSTDRGVVRMNLDTYWSEKRSYRLMVSEIKLDGKSVPIERGSGLTISRDMNSIEFVPEIVNYLLDNPKVSYYLEGFDSGYKTVLQSELTGVVYTNLPSGEYTFHLAILDEDTGGVWEESTYGFIKEKSIQDNSWFRVYMLLVGGLFVGWLAWFVTRVSVQQTIALQQERLSLALKQVQMGNETILAIAKTVDAKDILTSKHSQRVSDYSVLIARKYGFTEEEQENLRKAALLHDIGKIGIPDSILNKPDILTDREYAFMKTHVTSGAEILKDFTLIEHVVEGARYHHERYDGSGYPDGLSGKDIPLYGRIIAIADAFDAMTANRVYRKRLDFDYVMQELHKGRGTQFDPELLDLFLDVIGSGEINLKALYAEDAAEHGEGTTDA